jgi:RNA polymerase sigma-70 factor (ECF subfamily)
VVDHYRKPANAGTLESAAELAASDLSPEDHAIATEQERWLRAALDALPARERQVVELRLAGLTGIEIGEVLGCRSGAVGVAQFRAIRKLRALLSKEDTSEEGSRNV